LIEIGIHTYKRYYAKDKITGEQYRHLVYTSLAANAAGALGGSIGAGIGFFFGGPVGAALGGIIGGFVSSYGVRKLMDTTALALDP
jgi:membrane associated rhomboid family serine protease